MKKLTFSILAAALLMCCWALPGAEDVPPRTHDSSRKLTFPPALSNHAQPIYASKFGIESPTERLLAGETEPAADKHAISEASRGAALQQATVETKTEPGKVRWHDDFEAACLASRESGKPVLLFQLMGQLDEVFC